MGWRSIRNWLQLVNDMGERYSPPREEGWPRPQENVAKPPLRERTGWSFAPKRFGMRFEGWCVSDHPVCAAAVASRYFLTAQPPLLTRRGIAALAENNCICVTR